MQTYKDYAPTSFDVKGLALEDRQSWLVAPVSHTRDSGCLEESNFAAALTAIGGESETVEVHRFRHWACGWFEIIIIDPTSPAVKVAEELEKRLADYPSLDDDLLSAMEQAAADQIWRDCYRVKDRIDYIRKHRSEFDFTNFADLVGCVRGKFFAGYASDLVNR